MWARLGEHSLAWRTDAGDVEGIMVHVSGREIWIPIARGHPDAIWQAEIERQLSQNAEDGGNDDMRFTI
ncbi:hypothetical protein [Donghicola sp. XS_ASV15]|uniref:hypothetical protein n=1 Tax=Donghicola sp. XS_ASV15 TaxID=3241295 RepID=UPI003517E7A3